MWPEDCDLSVNGRVAAPPHAGQTPGKAASPASNSSSLLRPSPRLSMRAGSDRVAATDAHRPANHSGGPQSCPASPLVLFGCTPFGWAHPPPSSTHMNPLPTSPVRLAAPVCPRQRFALKSFVHVSLLAGVGALCAPHSSVPPHLIAPRSIRLRLLRNPLGRVPCASYAPRASLRVPKLPWRRASASWRSASCCASGANTESHSVPAQRTHAPSPSHLPRQRVPLARCVLHRGPIALGIFNGRATR